MTKNKTKSTTKSVPDFLNSIQDPVRREDCLTLATIMEGLRTFKHGKGCLYIKKLEDIELGMLKTLISTSVNRLKKA